MALSKFDGWVGEILLRAGDEYPDDHPLVTGRPEMFDVEQEPEDPSEVHKIMHEINTGRPVKPPVQPVKKKPGPKPGSSRTKPQT